MVEEMGSVDGNEISFEEFLLMTAMQIDTLSQILIEKGIITEEEFHAKFQEVQTRYIGEGQNS